MLQLMDLARENAALRSELERVREEAKVLRLLVRADADPAGTTLPFRQITRAGREGDAYSIT